MLRLSNEFVNYRHLKSGKAIAVSVDGWDCLVLSKARLKMKGKSEIVCYREVINTSIKGAFRLI